MPRSGQKAFPCIQNIACQSIGWARVIWLPPLKRGCYKNIVCAGLMKEFTKRLHSKFDCLNHEILPYFGISGFFHAFYKILGKILTLNSSHKKEENVQNLVLLVSYDMLYLLAEIGLTPDGSSTVIQYTFTHK